MQDIPDMGFLEDIAGSPLDSLRGGEKQTHLHNLQIYCQA